MFSCFDIHTAAKRIDVGFRISTFACSDGDELVVLLVVSGGCLCTIVWNDDGGIGGDTVGVRCRRLRFGSDDTGTALTAPRTRSIACCGGGKDARSRNLVRRGTYLHTGDRDGVII